MGTSVADGGVGIGTFGTDWANDILFSEIVPNFFDGILYLLFRKGYQGEESTWRLTSVSAAAQ